MRVSVVLVVAIVLVLALASCGSSEPTSQPPQEDASSNSLTFTNDEQRIVELGRCSPQACNSPVWTVVLEPGSSKKDVRVSNRNGFAAFAVRAHIAGRPGEGLPIGCFEFRFPKPRPAEKEILVRISEAGPC